MFLPEHEIFSSLAKPIINFPTIFIDWGSSSEAVFKNALSKNFAKFRGKHLCCSFSDNVAGLQPLALNFAKKVTPAQAFPWKPCKIFGTALMKNTKSGWLLLYWIQMESCIENVPAMSSNYRMLIAASFKQTWRLPDLVKNMLFKQRSKDVLYYRNDHYATDLGHFKDVSTTSRKIFFARTESYELLATSLITTFV